MGKAVRVRSYSAHYVTPCSGGFSVKFVGLLIGDHPRSSHRPARDVRECVRDSEGYLAWVRWGIFYRCEYSGANAD